MSNLFGYRYQKHQPEEEATSTAVSGAKEKPDTAGETETFWTRNVKLITFLICLFLFLAFFGPVSVFHIVDCAQESREARNAMTVEEVLTFADQRRSLSITQFEDYEGDEQNWGFGTYYFINAGENFRITVGSEISNGAVTYFTVTKRSTGEIMDVMESGFRISDLQAFMSTP